MWIKNDDTLKWESRTDRVVTDNYLFIRQELSSTRFYSKFLSGSTYVPINNTDDIYDILGKWRPRTWYVSSLDSVYSKSLVPARNPESINISSSYDYYTRYLSEYGLTLKNHFTPRRLMGDSLKNTLHVDAATTDILDLNSVYINLFIDGVVLKKGNKVLVKNQVTFETIDTSVDPNDYFEGNYYLTADIGGARQYSYYNSDNGIYIFDGSRLVRDTVFDDYSNCIRASVYIASGTLNGGKQFHLSRMLDGYYPSTSKAENIEFLDRKNWLLRHRVDYNNIFDINYYDVLGEFANNYTYTDKSTSRVYSIPDRIISIGEFGVILNNEEGVSTIIPNKYKVNLRSISKTSTHYWICGDDSTLLKVRKHDFYIDKVVIDGRDKLSSVSFHDDMRGVVVGELNTILLTFDGGVTWKRLSIEDFESFTYTKALFIERDRFFVVGRNGVFIEVRETIKGWMAYRRRISKFIDDDDEVVLYDNINDIILASVDFSTTTGTINNNLVAGAYIATTVVVSGDQTAKLSVGETFKFTYNTQIESGVWVGPVLTATYNSGPNTTTIQPNYTTAFAPVLGLSVNGAAPNNSGNQTVSTPTKVIFIVSDNGNIVMCRIDGVKIGNFDFVYLGFDSDYNDIKNIANVGGTNYFYFTNNDGLYRLDIDDYLTTGTYTNSYTNVITPSNSPIFVGEYYSNEILDYGPSLILVGNNSFFRTANYFSGIITSTTTLDVYDPQFESRLKSKLLFMDYDMASKLNFFTDSGEYRMPEPVVIDTFLGSTSHNYNFGANKKTNAQDSKENYVSVTVPYIVEKTRGRLTEIRVKLSLNMTNPSGVVSIFLRRRHKVGSVDKQWIMSIMRYGLAQKSANLTDVVFSTNKSLQRLSLTGGPYTGGLYRMDMVSGPYRVSDYITVDVSDLEEISGRVDGIDNVDDDWDIVVYDHYGSGVTMNNFSIQFMMEDSYLSFGEKTTPAIAPSYVAKTEKNWWTYKSNTEMTFPYASGQSLSDSGKVFMSSTFQSYASYSVSFPYYISQFSSIPLTVSVDTSDLKKLFPSYGTSSISRFVGGGTISLGLSTSPLYSTGPVLYLYEGLGVLCVDTNWSVDVGDVISFESSEVSSKLVVNRIVSGVSDSGGGQQVVRKYVYVYTEFNGSIVNELVRSTDIVMINLNKYLSSDDLVKNISNHPIGLAYSLVHSDTENKISISPKFNNNTAYYNLGAVVEYSGVRATMSYQDSFLNFGYSPTYNILDYLERLNVSVANPTFYYDKEYYSMPVYVGIPFQTSFTASSFYIDATGNEYSKYKKNGKDDPFNVIALGPALLLEWQSLMLNTFVDVQIVQSGMTYSSDRMLVMNKYAVSNYLNSGITAYIVEFNKRLSFVVGGTLNGSYLNIISRRKLGQISQDLQELNNIHKANLRKVDLSSNIYNSSFSVHEREMSYKIPTDSYAKVLLSDSDTVQALSALMYVDDKNELSMNVTTLDKLYNIGIDNTFDYNGYLAINCSKKHGLNVGDGVVLEFNGGPGSSEFQNPEYFGFTSVTQIINEYDFVTTKNYGILVFVGNDIGNVRFMKKDPFFNYQPVDIIEIGSDRGSHISVKVEPEMVRLEGYTYSLVGVDWERYRFKLVDGLTLESLDLSYPWVLEAEISDAVIGVGNGGINWYMGVWESGRWFGGTWNSGDWLSGDWYGGTWNSYDVKRVGLKYVVDQKTIDYTKSVWRGGRWYGGTWNNGTWVNGRWYAGDWNSGWWYNGIWNNGTWNQGNFIGGIWVLGLWVDGYFSCDNEPAFWLDGEWQSGDFENGIWYNGSFGTLGNSRFGVNSSNSRTAIWYGGKWNSGTFQSGSDLDDTGISLVHKYSIWYSGQWFSGDWLGGIAYGINFKSGVWKGGIIEEVQIIGVNYANNSFTLNGVFRYNLGDRIYLLDNNYTTDFSYLGSNTSPGVYTVLKTVVDEKNRITEIYTSSSMDGIGLYSFKKVSGPLDLPIPNTSTILSHTQSVAYTGTDIAEVRVRVSLHNTYVGNLMINLRSPNGQVINVKQSGVGGIINTLSGVGNEYLSPGNVDMMHTTFTTDVADDFSVATSPYTGLYSMSKSLNAGVGSVMPVSTTDYVSGLLNDDGGVIGDWSLYVWDDRPDISVNPDGSVITCVARYSNLGDQYRITITKIGNVNLVNYTEKIRPGDMLEFTINTIQKVSSVVDSVFGTSQLTHIFLSATASSSIGSLFTTIPQGWDPDLGNYYSNVNIKSWSNPQETNLLNEWEIQFVASDDVGSQVGRTISDGFDTGLRAVALFENVDWQSGIWTNGIFENGNFRSGLWYNGIFDGDWGK